MNDKSEPLIVTVIIDLEPALSKALLAGEAVAKPLFAKMEQFNLEQMALGGS